MEIFERIFWTARPGFPARIRYPSTRYALTDLRVTVKRGAVLFHEIALDDILDVELAQSWRQRVTATSTVVLRGRRGSRITLRDIRHGPQLALILQLLSGDRMHAAALDTDFIERALREDAPRLLRPRHGLMAGAAAALAVTLVAAGLARRTTLPPVTYGADDPIAPNGVRRSDAEIIAFMQRDVMPFARHALAPVVGAANVSCSTCHGSDGAARGWRMPGVRALPEPDVRLAGMERSPFWIDPQIRNAVYGYLAEEDKLPTAAYMREVVMPGMAAVMRRPAYDFTRSYSYNRAHVAVGCYHCHRVQ